MVKLNSEFKMCAMWKAIGLLLCGENTKARINKLLKVLLVPLLQKLEDQNMNYF